MDPTTEAAPAASLESRIADRFSGTRQTAPTETQAPPETPPDTEQSTDTEATSESTAEETFELDHDGEKYVLPKKLEQSFMHHKDYTQKTQSLADTRRQIELVQQQARVAQSLAGFDQTLASEIQQLSAYDWALEQAKTINWASMSTEEMLRKKLEIDGYKDQRETLAKTIDGKRQEFMKTQQAEIEKIKAQSLEILKKRIPNWGEDVMKAIRSHAIQDGYTESELGSILDPRHAVTLWKASQYDALQAKATPTIPAAKTVKTTPSNPMPQRVKETLAFRKTLQKAPPGSPERKRAVEDRVASIFQR